MPIQYQGTDGLGRHTAAVSCLNGHVGLRIPPAYKELFHLVIGDFENGQKMLPRPVAELSAYLEHRGFVRADEPSLAYTLPADLPDSELLAITESKDKPWKFGVLPGAVTAGSGIISHSVVSDG